MAKKASPKRVRFEFKAEPSCKVYIAGTFNDWDACQIKMMDKKGDGTYTASLLLAPGRHEYKFVVNGSWRADPTCGDSVQNDKGSINSVTTVGD